MKKITVTNRFLSVLSSVIAFIAYIICLVVYLVVQDTKSIKLADKHIENQEYIEAYDSLDRAYIRRGEINKKKSYIIDLMEKDKYYSIAIAYMDCGFYTEAIDLFMNCRDYLDSEILIDTCLDHINMG